MRFEEVKLLSRDPARLAAFYGALGFETRRDAARVGRTTLRFVEGEATGPVHLAFNVPEDRLLDALAHVRARAPIRASDEGEVVHFERWDAHAFYFDDPDGNVLECIARHALPSAYAGPFGADAFEGVSEVGWPVDDVQKAVDTLSARLSEPPWRPASPNFGTVGDEHGLLIVVRKGRAWFPTSIGAAAAPLEVRIEGKEPLRP